MIVDNRSELNKAMAFKPGTYYKFVVLQRKKDGDTLFKDKDRKEIIVKQWLVDSQEKLDKVLPDMVTLVNTIGGRLYMATDRKSVAKTLFTMQDTINGYIRQMFNGQVTDISTKQLNKILASASSVAESTDGDKRWLFDVDTKHYTAVACLKDYLCDNYLATFETKNGYHVIAARKFDGHALVEKMRKYFVGIPTQYFFNGDGKFLIECKDNALVLVYANIEEYWERKYDSCD